MEPLLSPHAPILNSPYTTEMLVVDTGTGATGELDAVDAALAQKREEDEALQTLLVDKRALERNLAQMDDVALREVYKSLQRIRKQRANAKLDADIGGSHENFVDLKAPAAQSTERRSYESSMLLKVVALMKKDLYSRLRDIKSALCSTFCPLIFVLLLGMICALDKRTKNRLKVGEDRSPYESNDYYENSIPIDFESDLDATYVQNTLICLEQQPINKVHFHTGLKLTLKGYASIDNTEDDYRAVVERVYGVPQQYIQSSNSSYDEYTYYLHIQFNANNRDQFDDYDKRDDVKYAFGTGDAYNLWWDEDEYNWQQYDDRVIVTKEGKYEMRVETFQVKWRVLMLGNTDGKSTYLRFPQFRQPMEYCVRNKTYNVDSRYSDIKTWVPAYNYIRWDSKLWDANQKSFQSMLLFGLFWAIVMMFTTPGKVLVEIVRERQSGIKALMSIMGLDQKTYWSSQFLSWFLESLTFNVVLSFLSALLVSQFREDFDDNISLSIYAFVSCFICYANVGPMIFAISSLLPSDKDANAAINMLRFVLPFVAPLVAFSYFNYEPTGIRMLLCIFPQCNFQFAFRDCMKGEVKADVVLMMFIGGGLWWLLTLYFDLVVATSQGQKDKDYCFCCYWRPAGWSNSEGLLEAPIFENTELANTGAIVMDKLTKTFPNGVTAVDGMSLVLQKGTVYGLLGFNGAGKTTCFNMLTGIIPMTSGNAYIDGLSVRTDMDRIRSNIGICPQHNIIWPSLSVADHLFLFGRLRGMSDMEVEHQIQPLLHRVDMTDQLYTRAGDLSGGQKRKLMLVSAFLGDPNVILLDEPTAGVDAESRRVMWDLILEKKQSRLIMMTTHQMREADVLCDKIGIMADGGLIAQGTPVELKESHGVGYSLTCSPKAEFQGLLKDPSKVSEIIKDVTDIVKVSAEGENIIIGISAEMVDLTGKIIAKLEDSSKFHSINVSATSLEDVFLRLSEQQNQRRLQNRRRNSEGYEFDDDDVNKIYPRPNELKQWGYLVLKRMYLNVLYWGPFLSGLVMVSLLAMLIYLLVSLTGLATAEFDLEPSDIDEVGCIYPEGMQNLCEVVSDRWSHVKHITEYDYENNYDGKRTDYKDTRIFFQVDTGGEMKDGNDIGRITHVYADPFFASYLTTSVSPTSSIHADPVEGSAGIYSIIVLLTLLVGIGLIVSSTWQYVGKEARGPLYEFQIQIGVNPAVFWMSHYMFDVAINVILVSILMAIALQSQKQTMIHDSIFVSFLSFLSYIWVQYFLVYHLKHESYVSNFLAWSFIFALILFIIEALCVILNPLNGFKFYFFMSFKEIGPADWQFCYVVNMFVPPMQFFATLSHVFFTGLSRDTMLKRLHGFRSMMACMAAIFYGILFALRVFYDMYKIDPLPHVPLYAVKEDVRQEKERVTHLMQSGGPTEGSVVCSHISKVYTKTTGPFVAVKDLCFAIKKGECFGLLGKNGAGKTTALKVLTGLIKPTAGDGYLNRYSSFHNSVEVRKQAGVCPQFQTMWDHFTVRQHLMFAGSLKGVPVTEINAEVERLCYEIGLTPYIGRQCAHLSGGNKRKLMLATALIGGSEVLFLDEPTAGVDPCARSQIMEFIKRYKENRAIILTTHQMEETEWICDRIGIMVNGDFEAIGTKEELINRNASGYSLEISIVNMNPAQVGVLQEYVSSNLDDTQITESDSLVIAFSVPESNPLSEIFQIADNLKAKYNCEYIISEMSIEQVFLNLTANQRKEDYEDLINAGRQIAQDRVQCCTCEVLCPCCVCCHGIC